MDDYTERLRQRAYQIWLDEGRPEGREAIHWDMARELVAIEDQQKKTTKPVRRRSDAKEVAADRAEPATPAAAMGELPTLPDAGEQIYPPSRMVEKAAKPRTFPAKESATAKVPAAKPPAAVSGRTQSTKVAEKKAAAMTSAPIKTPAAKPEIRPAARKSEPTRTSSPRTPGK